MHSSRMPTARLSIVSHSAGGRICPMGFCPGGVSAQGVSVWDGVCPGDVCPGWMSAKWGCLSCWVYTPDQRQTPPPCEQND